MNLQFLSVLLVCLVLCTNGGIFFWIKKFEKEHLNDFIASQVSEAVARVNVGLEERLLALDRMALRLRGASAKERQHWLSDAKALYRDFAGFQAIEWADADTKVRWIYPIEGNEAANGLVLNLEEYREQAIKSAINEKQGQLTRPVELKQGGTGFLSLHPTFKSPKNKKNVTGFIVGVYKAEDLFKDILPIENHSIRLSYGNQLIFSTDTKNESERLTAYSMNEKIQVRNASFNAKILPTGHYIDAHQKNNSHVYQLMILLVLSSMGLIFLLIRISRDHGDLIRTTAALEKERYKSIQASKMATLGEMGGGIAHEINNPLAIIHGLIFQLQKTLEVKKELPDDLLQKNLSTMETCVSRMATIVKGLRVFARDASSEDIVDVDFKQIIDETMVFVEGRLRNNGVDFNVDAPGDYVVNGRKIQLSQALLNLLNNAFDAVKDNAQSDKKISLELTCQNKLLVVKIIDNGPGVGPEIADSIFEPFKTSKDVGEGTGLGLSITKGIVESHNGEIRVSHLAQPTVFEMTIPLATKGSKSQEAG